MLFVVFSTFSTSKNKDFCRQEKILRLEIEFQRTFMGKLTKKDSSKSKVGRSCARSDPLGLVAEIV